MNNDNSNNKFQPYCSDIWLLLVYIDGFWKVIKFRTIHKTLYIKLKNRLAIGNAWYCCDSFKVL